MAESKLREHRQGEYEMIKTGVKDKKAVVKPLSVLYNYK